MHQFVRQSKFRHVYCKPIKHEFCLQDVRITKVSWDSLFCAVNPKFIAIITEGSGGPFVVVPLTKTGRLEKDYPIVDAHRAPCLEVAWCPFNDNVIASCSEDATAKVWHIPDKGLHRNLSEPIVALCGHQKRVSSVVWHPSANSVLMTAGADHKILIWNVGTGEALIEIAGHPDQIWSVGFNYNGSKIITTCKDKKIRVIDPRSGQILQQGAGHEGLKPQRAIFLKNGQIFSTGFTRRSERIYALRNEESIEEPVVQEELDTSNGALNPLYDQDTGIIYLCAKGDSNVRFYEVNSDPPFVHFIDIYTTPEPQRGIAFMPKRGLNIVENEISRILKVTNKGVVDVLQFFVPRKSDLFQDDLYPDTAAPTPAISADEWMGGKDADPIMMPVPQSGVADAGAAGEVKTKVKKKNILAEMPTATSANVVQSSPAPTAAETAPTSVATSVDTKPKERPKATEGIEIAQPKATPVAAAAPPPDKQHTYEQQKAQGRHDKFSAAKAGFGDAAAEPRETAAPQRHSMHAPTTTAQPISQRPASTHDPPVQQQPAPATGAEMDELLLDVQKLKAVVRTHERRIRALEDQLAERHMMDVDGMLRNQQSTGTIS